MTGSQETKSRLINTGFCKNEISTWPGNVNMDMHSLIRAGWQQWDGSLLEKGAGVIDGK